MNEVVAVEGLSTLSSAGYTTWTMTLVQPTAISNYFVPGSNSYAHNTCREYFVSAIRSVVMSRIGHDGKKHKPFFAGRLRYVVCGGNLLKIPEESVEKNIDTFLSSIERGIKLLNLFEDTYSWPRTLFCKARFNVAQSEYHPLVLISASHKWLRSPYLVSLHTLLLRLGRSFSKTFTSLEDFYANLRYFSSERNTSDISQAITTYVYWEVFFKHYQFLFGKHSLSYNWSQERLDGKRLTGGSLRSEGIRTLLVYENPMNPDLAKKVKELSNPYNERKRK